MYYLFIVQVLQAWYYLTTYFLQFLHREGPALVPEVLEHVSTLLEFHDDMEFIVFCESVVCVYKILIFNYTWMYQIFSNHEFAKHFAHCTICNVGIVEDLSSFINETALKAADPALENFCLSPTRQLLFPLDVQFIEVLAIWPIENLIFWIHLNFGKRRAQALWVSIILQHLFTVNDFCDVAICSYYGWYLSLTHFRDNIWEIVKLPGHICHLLLETYAALGIGLTR